MTPDGPSTDNATEDTTDRSTWQSRPWLGRFLRVLIAAIPLTIAFAVTIVLGHVFAKTSWPISARIGWAIAMFGVATVVSRIVGRFTQRLTPLSALCHMNMAFPNEAPNRMKLALQLGDSTNTVSR
jgi:hypothetical protein